MKQIENMQKKAYAEPKIKVVGLKCTYILAGSGGNQPEDEPEEQPHWYGDELD